MLYMPDAAEAVIRGSWRPQYAVDAWYDGELVREALPVTAASLTFDAARPIHAAGSITCGSTDDTLIPTRWDAPLACYGSELHIRSGIPIPGRDTEWFSWGWYRIDDFEAQEWWQPYSRANDNSSGLLPADDLLPDEDVYPSGRTPRDDDFAVKWVCRGTLVTNNLSDRMALLEDASFAVPEQPASLASVIAEIKRLVDGIVTVADLSSITDGPIPFDLVYDTSRVDAVNALAAVIGRTARMDRDGDLTLVPSAPVTSDPVWTVTVADGDVARLIAWARKGDRGGLANQVVSTGASSDGAPTQGVATLASGPLRFDGPFGRVPTTRTTPLLTSNALAAADAAAALVDVGGAQTVQVPLTVPAHPALEVGDTIAAELPTTTLTGPVTSLAPTFGAGTMQATIAVSREQLWGVTA